MFKPQEKVVYPGHGVAQIIRIVTKTMGKEINHFFELQFLNKDVTILVSIEMAREVGLRKLSSQECINDVLKVLAEPYIPAQQEMPVINWSKRNKEYMGKLRSGDIAEIGIIYRNLKYIEAMKGLSFGEKSLLKQTEMMLIEEIALVSNMGQDTATQYVRSLIQK